MTSDVIKRALRAAYVKAAAEGDVAAMQATDAVLWTRTHCLYTLFENEYEKTAAFRAAARAGHVHVLQWMVSNGDITIANDECLSVGYYSAVEAASHGQLEVLRWLFEAQGLASDWPAAYSASLLQFATNTRHTAKVLGYLCDHPDIALDGLLWRDHIARRAHVRATVAAALIKRRRWSRLRVAWFVGASACVTRGPAPDK